MATIDVLLPVKDGMQFLAHSLDSIRAQSFKDWRLIVLDHGSVDGSRELAQAYGEEDRRIEVRSFPDADGLAGLLNRGLDICDCKFVMRHDADDIAYPKRMEQSIAAFGDDPACAVIGGQADVIDGAGEMTGSLSMPVGRVRVASASLFHNPIAHPTVMMDFAAIRRFGARYGIDFLKILPSAQSIEVKNLAEDYFLFGQLAIRGACNNIPQKLIQYRSHGGNVSTKHSIEQVKVALVISRFLMRSFCALHDLRYYDPAPFCNHGGRLFEFEGQDMFDREFDAMSAGLLQSLGASPELERELAYRRSIATRNAVRLATRHILFKARHRPEPGEWSTVREWIIGRLLGRNRIRAMAETNL